MILKGKGVASVILKYTGLQNNQELKQRIKLMSYKTFVLLIFNDRSLNTL